MHDIFKDAMFLAVAVSLTETIAQTFIKTSVDVKSLSLGIIFYIVVGFILEHSYKYVPLSKFNTIWSSMSIVIATALGYFLYHENITQNNIISVFFALLAIYFSNL